MTENIPSRPKLPGSLAASLRSRSASTPSAPARSLPNLPVSNPVKAPVSNPAAPSPAQTPSVPRATATGRSLPAVPIQNAAPVITERQPVVPPVKEPKVSANRSAAAKKRNRGSVITPRDKAMMKFLGKVNIATALLISEAMFAFKYKDVRTGELKPASVDGIKARLTVLRKAGLVDYKNNRAGTTIWFLTWDGYEAIDKAYPDNRPRHARTAVAPKPQKARVAPKQSKWAHTLGLAALIIHFKKDGYAFITDDEMLSASEEMRALTKDSKGYVPDSDIVADLSFKDVDQFRDHADHFTFPNRDGGSHRPDLVITKKGEGVTAVELELHRKNTKELTGNFVGDALAIKCGRFDSFVYLVDPKIETFVRRYLNETAEGSNPRLREFFDRISVQTFNATEWNAAVPEM